MIVMIILNKKKQVIIMQILINYKNEEESKSVSINSTDIRTYVSTEIDETKTQDLVNFGNELQTLIQKYFSK